METKTMNMTKNSKFQDRAVLTDADLDAVSGGMSNTRATNPDGEMLYLGAAATNPMAAITIGACFVFGVGLGHESVRHGVLPPL
jgi:hypothetical protein